MKIKSNPVHNKYSRCSRGHWTSYFPPVDIVVVIEEFGLRRPTIGAAVVGG